MVAVLVVVLNHLFGWPRGGFVGVDVFFVISGFLITGLLNREYQATGRISFVGFYRRRIRRIFPIATFVLLVTVGASYALYLTTRANTVAIDAVWTFFFAANWHLALGGTDYWSNDAFISPLQHYWSLAVEEQFYLLWPWLMVGALVFAARRRWTARTGQVTLLALLFALTAGSFGWAVVQTTSNPTWAYFSTFSRAWELGAGALLALLVPALKRLPDAVRPLLAWAGLVGIGASVLLLSSASRIPAPGVGAAVLSTCLVIAAGTAGRQAYLAPLTNRVSGYIGNISYSLYLWHFPVLTLLAVVRPPDGRYYLWALVLMFALSVASYHGLENPIRRSTWLEPLTPAQRRRKRRHGSRSYLRVHRWPIVGLALTAVAALSLVAMVLQPKPVTTSGPTATAPPLPPLASSSPKGLPAARTVQINAALRATSFPKLTPAVNDLGIQNWAKEVAADGCFDVTPEIVDSCVSGSGKAKKDVVVLGDSYAVAWMPAIRRVFEDRGWKVHPLTLGQCPSVTVAVTQSGGADFPECSRHRTWAEEQIATLKPDLVILADANNTMDRLKSRATGAGATAELRKGIASTLKAITPLTDRVVVLAPPPAGQNLQDCVTRVSKPANCIQTITPAWFTFRDALQAGSTAGKADFIDGHQWFCNEQNFCPGFVDTTPVRTDGSHLTVAYSRSVAPLLAERLFP